MKKTFKQTKTFVFTLLALALVSSFGMLKGLSAGASSGELPSSSENVSAESSEAEPVVPMPFADGSGTLGTVAWNITGDTLTLSAGTLPDSFVPPWYLGDHTYDNTIAKINITGSIVAGKSLKNMFANLSALTDITGLNFFDTSNTEDMSRMFYLSSKLNNPEVGNFKTSNVTNMSEMFYYCYTITELEVDTWDTSKVTDMHHMFYYCEALTMIDVSNWKTSNVTNMNYLFYSCSKVTELDVSGWDTSNVTNMGNLFGVCNTLTELDVSNWKTSNVTDMNLLFFYCAGLTELDVSKWGTSNVTNMAGVFNSCTNLEQLDVSDWDTSNVTTMEGLFSGTWSLPTINVSDWGTSNVTDMSAMFSGMKSLPSLDITNFDTSKVTSMKYMFSGCESLDTIDLTSFDTTKVRTMHRMFFESGFTELDLSTFSDVSLDFTMYQGGNEEIFSRCPRLKKVNISSFTKSNATSQGSDLFTETPVVEIILGNNYQLTDSDLAISQFVAGELDDYSDEWLCVSDGTVYVNGPAFIAGYNSSKVASSYIRLGFKYDIVLDGNGGKDAANAITKIIPTRNKVDPRDGVQPTKLDYVFLRTGYSFVDWNTAAGGGGTAYEITDDVINVATTAGETVTFYAQWYAIPYKVTFDANGGVGVIPDVDPIYYEDFIPQPTATVTMDHFELGGWYTDTARTIKWDFTVDQMPANNLTLYAGWDQVEWKVSYSLNGGDSQSDPAYNDIYVRYGTAVPQPVTPTKSHFECTGWYRDVSATSQWNFTGDVMPKADLVLYAGWEQVEWEVFYHVNDASLQSDPQYQSIYVRYGTPIPAPAVAPTRLFKCTGWYKDLATTALWNFTTEMMPKADVSLYAGWERTHWEVFFDASGGDGSSLPTDLITPVNKPLDISSYQPDAASAPNYSKYGFLGWKDQNGTVVGNGIYVVTSDVYLSAGWTPLADLITRKKENIVAYKNENTASEIIAAIDATAEYTDYLGILHTFPVNLEWNPVWLTEGGVNEIKFYLIDPSDGQQVYGKAVSDLYVLNRPYITGNQDIYTFEGESIVANEEGVYGYGETPNFEEKRIDRGVLDLTFHDEAVNIWEAGLYWASYSGGFQDYDLKNSTFSFPVTVHVRKRAGLTREEQLQVDSSAFWLKTTEIYHSMKEGQIIDVTSENYVDGGTLRTEKVSAGSGYDRQLNVEVGKYIFMSPNILNILEEEKTGQLNVNLDGRSWIFNSTNTEAIGNNFPKGYYNLRMSLGTKEEITNLVGAETPQMQLQFEMNRPWFGTPTFVIPPNDVVKQSIENGAIPYLFHYNESTNELELVGAMAVESSGNLSIPMNGVYKEYVILASLPASGNYRITEHTNALDSQTYSAVAENIIDSGHVLPSGSGLSGISTTKYAITTTDEVAIDKSSSSQNVTKAIRMVISGVALLGVGGFYFKKRKQNDD